MSKCENWRPCGAIVAPACCPRKEAEIQLSVVYGPGVSGELRDVLRLCKACAERVRMDASRHGYEVRQEEIPGVE